MSNNAMDWQQGDEEQSNSSPYNGGEEEPERVKIFNEFKRLNDLNSTLVEGDTWVIISDSWFKDFEKYGTPRNSDPQSPGPLDNADIVEDDGWLRKNLSERYDYWIIHENTANILYNHFGGGPKIERKVITNANKSLIIDVNPLRVRLVRDDDADKVKIPLVVSGHISCAGFIDLICDKLSIPDRQNIRVWDFYNDKIFAVIEYSTSMVLSSKNILDNNAILVEFKDSDGKFARPDIQKPTYGTSNYRGYDDNVAGAPAEIGLVGLKNLGNTCFMNSALQCLSNTPKLTKYFIEKKHLGHINIDNVLGTKGDLAKEYGKLLDNIHSNSYTSVAPRDFKLTLGRHAEQFANYNQHDSQELLGFMLDKVHEDLNLVTHKPIIENIDSDGTGDQSAIAKKCWENYLLRNKSIIVDLFQGQLKSKVTCPEERCNKVSVTYDPLMYLSVPLPTEGERKMKVHLLREDGTPYQRYFISVPKNGKVIEIKKALSKITHISPQNFVLFDIYSKKIYSEFTDDTLIVDVGNNDFVAVHEVKNMPEEGWYFHQVYFRTDSIYSSSYYGTSPFLDPISISVKEGVTTVGDVIKNIGIVLQKRYFKDGVEFDESDELFELYQAKKTVRGSKSEEGKLLDTISILKKTDAISVVISNTKKAAYFDDYKTDRPEIVNALGDGESKEDNAEGVNIFNCLDKFTCEEILDETNEWYCSSCKEHKRAKKQLDIWKLPEYLVIHIKRFQYDASSNGFGIRDKIDTHVDFPFDLDLSSYIKDPDAVDGNYSLYAVSNHFGGMGGGHYTAYCKNNKNNKWYDFDDARVSELRDEKQIISSNAYLLFYKRDVKEEDKNDLELTDVGGGEVEEKEE